MLENQNEKLPLPKVVLDTNVLVSSLISAKGPPANIIRLVGVNRILPCYNSEILDEYRKVLRYQKFNFTLFQVESILNGILTRGIFIEAVKSKIKMPDESDRKFYDLHKSAVAILVTGNTKHFPKEDSIMKPAAFMEYIFG